MIEGYGAGYESAMAAWRPVVKRAREKEEERELIELQEEDGKGKGEKEDDGVKEETLEEYLPLSDEMMEAYGMMLQKEKFESITPLVFGLFWSWEIADLHVPGDLYRGEGERIKREIKKLESSLSMGNKRSNEAGKEDKMRLVSMKKTLISLREEEETGRKKMRRVRRIIEEKKEDFFGGLDPSAWGGSEIAFLTTCLIPRLLMSPEDAWYSARFLSLMHSQEVPKFGSLTAYDVIMKAFPAILEAATEREARGVGVFMKEVRMRTAYIPTEYDHSKHKRRPLRSSFFPPAAGFGYYKDLDERRC